MPIFGKKTSAPPQRAFPVWVATGLAALLFAAAFLAVLGSQPVDGRVVGRVYDRTNQAPLPGIEITLDAESAGDSETDTAYVSGPSSDSSAFVSTNAPSGWAGGADSDANKTLTGADQETRTEWRVISDDQGHFVFPQVPVGQYKITTDSSDKEIQVYVTESDSAHVDLPLDPPQPSLNFETPSLNWIPGEIPKLTLSGDTTSETVNFEIDKVDLDSAAKSEPMLIASPAQNGEALDSKWFSTPSDKRALTAGYTEVRGWSIPLSGRDNTGSFIERISVADSSGVALSPGVYRLTAEVADHGGNTTSTAWLRITNLALITKSWNGKMLAQVVNIKTGVAIPNAQVAVFDSTDTSKPLGSSITSATGLATLATTGAAKESSAVVIARVGDSVAGLTFDANSPGSEGDSDDDNSSGDLTGGPALRSFVYTDRPVYRPGQTVYMKGILRHFARPAGFSVPAGQKADIQVKDAMNAVVYHTTVTTDSLGTWNSSFALSTETLTGEYTITTDLAGQSTDQTFLVAAYQKPEFQAKIAFDRTRYVHGDTIHATISGSYYFGAPMIGAKSDVDVYSGEPPNDPDTIHSSEYHDNGNDDGAPVLSKTYSLGANGSVEVDVPTDSGDQDHAIAQPEDYTVDVTITDASGQTVSTTGNAEVAQGLFDLNVTSATGVCNARTVDEATVTTTNPDSSPKIGQAVSVETYYDDWSDGVEHKTPLSSTTVTTDSQGNAVFPVTPPHDGLVVIHAVATDSRRDKIDAESQIWVSSGDVDLPAHYADLSLTLDKQKYQPGQTAHLLINTAHPGPSALITIEGADLYSTQVVQLSHHSNEVSIPVDLGFVPSVTVSATCIYNKQDLSSVAVLTIDDARRPLHVTVASDRTSYGPEDKATLTVTTKDNNGKPVPAEVSLGVVDSSVYAIAPEDTRNIVDALEPDQGNVVTTTTSCAEVFYGDVDKGATDIDIRRKFPDTALWKPDVMTDSSGHATVTFTLPDNLTTWHATCVGVTQETQVGRATADFTVSKPIVARLEMPTFLVAGDKSQITEVVNNNQASGEDSIKIDAPGLKINSSQSASVNSSPSSPGSQTWNVDAPTPGTVNVTATARSSAGTDGLQLPLPVEPHVTYNSVWNSGKIDLGNGSTQSVAIPISVSGDPSQAQVRIRISPTPRAAIVSAAKYLSAYPYGSSDDIASTLLGDAVVAQMAGLRGKPRVIQLRSDEMSTLDDMTTRSVLRLAHHTATDGGWGWFPTDSSDLYMTSYALWSVSVAKWSGYPMDSDTLNNALTRCGELANSERIYRPHKSPDIDALSYAALALARLGKTLPAANITTYLERREASDPLDVGMEERARVALAESALGPKFSARAQAGMTQLWSLARQTGDMDSWTMDFHRGQAGVTEDTPDVDTTAWVMLAAQQITPNDPRLDGAALWLMSNRDDDHWTDCPRTTATTLLALSSYFAHGNEFSPNYTADVSVNGKHLQTLHVSPSSIDDPTTLITVPGSDLIQGGNTITISTVGLTAKGRCYYSVETRIAMPVSAPSEPSLFARLVDRILNGNQPFHANSAGYHVKRVYLRMTSRRNFFMEDTVPAPDTSFNPQEDIVVRLIVDCTRPGSQIVVEEPIPAGCRITELSGDQYDDWSNWWDYTDVRDDKLVFFIYNLPRGRHEIDYHLQAKTPGRYDALPTIITSTADPTLQATGDVSRIWIDD